MKTFMIVCLAAILAQLPIHGADHSTQVDQLQKATAELSDLLTKYTDAHPLVVAKHKEIAALENLPAQTSEPTSVLELRDNSGHIVATVTLVSGSSIVAEAPAMRLDPAGTRFRTLTNPGSKVRVVSASGNDLFTIGCSTNSSVQYESIAVRK